MMEEVTSDSHQETGTSKAGLETGIADQLQDAATTNVTQAGSGSRESSPPVSVASPVAGMVAMPTKLPTHLLTSSVPPVSALPTTAGAFVTPTKGYLSPITSPLGAPSTYTSQVRSPGGSYLSSVTSPSASPGNYSTSTLPQSYTSAPNVVPSPYEVGTSRVTLEDVPEGGASDEALGPIYPHPDEAHSGTGLFRWISSSTFVHKVMEKTKSSVETMITTLDPGMKEVIHRGGTIDIIVTSHRDVKVLPVRQAFQEVFGRATVDGMASQPNIAPQPVGYTAALKGAEERISNLRTSGAIGEQQAVVSIENFIVELLPSKWFDIPCVLLVDPVYDLRLETFGQAVPIPAEYVMQAQDDTPNDYTLRWSGLAITIGQVIERNLPHVRHADWHRAFTGVSRTDLILTAARVLAGMYKAQLPPESLNEMQ